MSQLGTACRPLNGQHERHHRPKVPHINALWVPSRARFGITPTVAIFAPLQKHSLHSLTEIAAHYGQAAQVYQITPLAARGNY